VKIVSLSRRPQREVPPKRVEEIFLRAGIGIDGDCHASPISPRQVLLASTGAYEYCDIPPGSLRENILIKVNDLRLFSGSLVRVGRDAAIRITFECEPCGRLNRVRPNLSKDIRGKRGYLARVVRSGVIRPGDKIQVEGRMFSPLSDDWRDRVIAIAQMVPSGFVVSYTRLAELAGVPKSFCRAFPRLLRSRLDASRQRVVPSSQLSDAPSLPIWLGREVFEDDVQFN
jgi:alkylated DNA nucleotide flippase Atl1